MDKKRIVGLMIFILLGAFVAYTDQVEVFVESWPGYLDIDAYHFHDGNIASHHWFQAQGGFEVSFRTRRNDAANSWYDELVTSIMAHSLPGSGAMFHTVWFQDFNYTYTWGSEYSGEVGAYVFGTDGAMMNVGSGNFATFVSMDSYPAWSTPPLMADGTGTDGFYELRTWAAVWEGPDDLEAYSSIHVVGTGGTAWQSLGYKMKAGWMPVHGYGVVVSPPGGGSIGYLPPLGTVWATTLYVDGGEGAYIREAYGDDYLATELGVFPGGGSLQASANFYDGMLSRFWTIAE